MLRKVGDHVTGDATLRKIVEERLALNMKAFTDGGYDIGPSWHAQ